MLGIDEPKDQRTKISKLNGPVMSAGGPMADGADLLWTGNHVV